jgi:Phosphotransferase enzyme family
VTARVLGGATMPDRAPGTVRWLDTLVRAHSPGLPAHCAVRRRILNMQSTSSVLYAVEAHDATGTITHRWVLKVPRERSPEHRREVAFYRHFAPAVLGLVPAFLGGEDTEAAAYLLLSDESTGRGPRQPDLASLSDLVQIVRCLAGLHAGLWAPDAAAAARAGIGGPDDRSARDAATLSELARAWSDDLSGSDLDRLRHAFDQRATLRRELSDATTVCHGDFHTLNVLTGGPTPVVIDWQNCYLGNPAEDLATLLAAYVHPLDRRRWGDGLTREYHTALASALDADRYPWPALCADLSIALRLALLTGIRLARIPGLPRGGALVRTKHVLMAVAEEFGDDR